MANTKLTLTPPVARQLIALAVLAAFAGLTACTSVTVAPPAGVAVPAAFSSVPAPASAASAANGDAASAATDLARWWLVLNDQTLNQLMATGLQANADIRIAVDRVKEARALLTQAESALYPTVVAGAGVGKSNPNQSLPQLALPGGIPLPLPSAMPMTSLSTAGFAAAWEVDIFGARRSDAEAAAQAALGYQERQHGAQMLLVSDIASNYFEARSVERRSAVLARSIATAQRLQRYAQGRFDAGQATRADIDRARSLVEELESQRQPLDMLLGVRLRRLAVLTGQAPQA
ncbi:MAG: TolC family protein, partial [Burkholderiaceae bacterium]|nr:TolC family protein [Burkholderiaceae bacterium]